MIINTLIIIFWLLVIIYILIESYIYDPLTVLCGCVLASIIVIAGIKIVTGIAPKGWIKTYTTAATISKKYIKDEKYGEGTTYGIGVERVALKNILEDSVLVSCVDKSSNETHKCTSEEVGDIPSYVDDHVRTDYISIFQYNDQIIKSRNKDIYDQVEVGKKYNARIKILIHNDQTENYDVAEIISGIKK